MLRIEIYSRPGCHLCDDAKAVIESARTPCPLDLKVINIETDPALEAKYGTEIPVIFINGQEAFRHRVDKARLERKLSELWNKSTS